MPVTKKATKSKKKSPRPSDEEETIPPIDVQYNPDIITGHLQEMQAIVDKKCSQIQKDVEFMKTSIQQAFNLELIKIPTQVKQMKLIRFREDFGESLEAVTRGAIGGYSFSTGGANIAHNDKNHKQNLKLLQTPAPSRVANALTELNMRHPREGEKMISLNGSPLGTFSTAVKAPKSGPSMIPMTPGVFLPLESGEIVNLDHVESLPPELKLDAANKVQALMNDMQSIMTKLKSKP